MLDDTQRELEEDELEAQLTETPDVFVGGINPGNLNPYKDENDV